MMLQVICSVYSSIFWCLLGDAIINDLIVLALGTKLPLEEEKYIGRSTFVFDVVQLERAEPPHFR